MTLVTVAASPNFIVQVSDRRLSDLNGRPVTDEECKAIHLRTHNAQFLIGYTGLAKAGRKRMSDVFMELLLETPAELRDNPSALTKHFASSLTALFKTSPIKGASPSSRRLTVIFTGFIYPDNKTSTGPFQALITNFQRWNVGDELEAWEEFTTEFHSPKVAETWPTLLQTVGQYQEGPEARIEPLRALLAKEKPPEAVRDKLVQEMTLMSASNPAIGAQLDTAILLPGRDPLWKYYSAENKWVTYAGDSVLLTLGDSFAVSRLEMKQEDTSAPAMVVPVVPRRQPCPCGSGRQYRLCHGRQRYVGV